MAKQLGLGDIPPDFELKDTSGSPVRLSNYVHRQPVVVVFNRGFI